MAVRAIRKGVYQATTHLAVVALVVFLFVCFGVILIILEPGLDERQTRLAAEMKEQRRQWGFRHPTSYTYTFRETCDCAPPVDTRYDVVVHRGRAEAVTDQPASADPVMSMGRLFRLLDDAIVDAEAVEVEYDPAYGYPKRIRIDPAVSTMDDQKLLEISDFQILSQ